MTPASRAAADALTQALGVAYRDWQLEWMERDPNAALNGLMFGFSEILAHLYGHGHTPAGAMASIDEFLCKLREELVQREL